MSVPLLLWKDLRRESRSKETIQAGLVLVALFFVLDLFAFAELGDAPRVAAVVIWTPILFASAAALGRAMQSEADQGTLELLRAAPVPRLNHGIARTILHLLVLLLLAAFTVALAAALWRIPVTAALLGVLLLAVIGIALIGSLTAGLAAQARAREMLLPILMVPVLVPLLLAGVQATIGALAGADLAGLRAPLLLMLGYDLLAAAAAWFLWPVVMEGE